MYLLALTALLQFTSDSQVIRPTPQPIINTAPTQVVEEVQYTQSAKVTATHRPHWRKGVEGLPTGKGLEVKGREGRGAVVLDHCRFN
jgi:hypothetical protein